MPLTVNLRQLTDEPRRLQGELEVDELDLDVRDEMVRAAKPLRYDFEVQKMEHSLLLLGSLELTLECQCVRCLKPFAYELKLDHWTRHLPLEGEEKAVVTNDCVDLTPFIREDILLEFPQHPLCKAECGGLPKAYPGKARKASEASQNPDGSTWAELDKLKF